MPMQGEELKAIRKRIGWTQGDMAKALGLSPTFIGLMERGDRPVERRTELAARYLATLKIGQLHELIYPSD